MAKSLVRITTGQMDFSGGVDSNRVPLIASDANPNGLKANQLCWANNATLRGGGISPRAGWVYRATLPTKDLFQEAQMYAPLLDQFPYPIAQIGGRTFRVRTDDDSYDVEELTIGGNPNPANRPQSWMVQGEDFLIIQDGVSEPLVWDGNQLRRITAMLPANPKLPAGESMDYYMGRIWLGAGRTYIAGDIVRGPSGSAAYGFRDSILAVTENTYITTGGAFTVPEQAGNIRAIKHSANLDTALGQGQLYVFTRQSIYSTNVTPTRAEWALLKEPLQRVAQINFGTTSDRSVVPENGDLFFQSVDGVRSLILAIRYFEQWGNTPISSEEQRAVALNDKELLRFGSGCEFDNRLLETCLPYESPVGVAHKALLPLDFELINSLSSKLPPAWEGAWEGLNHLRIMSADFGGRQRCFSFVWSDRNQAIELWELTRDNQEDSGDDGNDRIQWLFELPQYDWGNPFQLKELETMELWIDRLRGNAEFFVDYRPGSDPCWHHWHYWVECAAQNNCEDVGVLQPCPYPTQNYKPQYRALMTLPKPPVVCNTTNGRPSNLDYTFQVRVRVKGSCRIRGLLLHALEKDRAAFEGLRCSQEADVRNQVS